MATQVGNVCDNCPSASNANQANSDGDANGNACDGCPTDANKIAPGACGCGVVDVDADEDLAFACAGDCNDNDRDIFPPRPAGPPRFDEPCDGKDIDCSDGLGGCERRTAACCAGAECGTVADGCGGSITCGGPDADADGFHACAGDCNDSDPDIHPNPPGTARFDEPCDGKDIDCSASSNGCEPLIGLCCGSTPGVPDCGRVPNGCGTGMVVCGTDADGDGYPAPCLDCDDDSSDDVPGDPRTFAVNIKPAPGVIDQACDGIDSNCDEPDFCEPYCREFECDAGGGEDKCGEVPDGCGGTYQCGECGVLEVCANSECCVNINPPPCDNELFGEGLYGSCGFVTDNCGGVKNCGACRAGNTCNGGQVNRPLQAHHVCPTVPTKNVASPMAAAGNVQRVRLASHAPDCSARAIATA